MLNRIASYEDINAFNKLASLNVKLTFHFSTYMYQNSFENLIPVR